MVCLHCFKEIPFLGDTCPYCLQPKAASQRLTLYVLQHELICCLLGMAIGWLVAGADRYDGAGTGAVIGALVGFVTVILRLIARSLAPSCTSGGGRCALLFIWALICGSVGVWGCIKLIDTTGVAPDDGMVGFVFFVIFFPLFFGVPFLISLLPENKDEEQHDVTDDGTPACGVYPRVKHAPRTVPCPHCASPLDVSFLREGTNSCGWCNEEFEVEEEHS